MSVCTASKDYSTHEPQRVLLWRPLHQLHPILNETQSFDLTAARQQSVLLSDWTALTAVHSGTCNCSPPAC